MAVALIVAAGSGERLGAGLPKALVPLAGRPLLHWSLDALLALDRLEHAVVALPAGVDALREADLDGNRVSAVAGGASRSESVRLALAAAPASETILVHDAARPLLTPGIASAVLAALDADPGAEAAIAAAPVSDTIKRAGADHAVAETLVRSELWSVQTPQVFRRGALESALEVPADVLAAATDDAALIERRGGRVLVVPTTAENLKVTTALDLQLAELLIAARGRDPA
ncbi:MAG TPA: 2-C-methyl-D-erythritol 4-phosphate cytidylyltransferase [Solirubrobacteraceae bacterium]|jgi:2-C-methyl-D-erythritol 4-phosphate cytidylyltransferase|nr:2-C-methyl-D-erythritol 4-phosphate cytidylyltransferase [Solirubrobacteraceae bacterium]